VERGSWQTAVRALCAIEAAVEASAAGTGSAASGEVAVHFQADASGIRRAQQAAQASVRQRAQRVLVLIGADTLVAEGASAASAASADLLGGEEPSEGVVQSGDGSDTGAFDLLAGLDVSIQPVAVPQSGSLDDLFLGGESVAASAPMTAAQPVQLQPHAAPQLHQAQPAGLTDFFSDLSLAGSQQQAASPVAAITGVGASFGAGQTGGAAFQPSSFAAPLIDPFMGTFGQWNDSTGIQMQQTQEKRVATSLQELSTAGSGLGGAPLRAGSSRLPPQKESAFSFVEGALQEARKN
jgi:hypothetical protein